jgi:hypothetical protein
MKRTLSFLKPVFDGLKWAGQGVSAMWRIGRFDYFPTEKNLLLSYWYDFRHFKRVAAGSTMYDFLDSRVVYIKRELEKADLSSKKRQMYRDFLGALHEPKLRERIIKFFESPNPEEHCKPLIDMIKAAWRMGEWVKAPSIAGLSEPFASSAAVAEPETEKDEVVRPDEKPALDAKTYVVAAEIHFELVGKTADYIKLSKHAPKLAGFVKRKFGVSQLPGSFRRLREYSYMKVLEEKNNSRLGQLRRNFNQIIEHPEIFGPAIVKRAEKILDDYFL